MWFFTCAFTIFTPDERRPRRSLERKAYARGVSRVQASDSPTAFHGCALVLYNESHWPSHYQMVGQREASCGYGKYRQQRLVNPPSLQNNNLIKFNTNAQRKVTVDNMLTVHHCPCHTIEQDDRCVCQRCHHVYPTHPHHGCLGCLRSSTACWMT